MAGGGGGRETKSGRGETFFTMVVRKAQVFLHPTLACANLRHIEHTVISGFVYGKEVGIA